MAEREIKQKVTCSDCINLVGDRHCNLQTEADSRNFGRIWFECGSKYPTSDPNIKRHCQHWERMP